MGDVAVARVALEVLEGAPVLDQHRSPRAGEVPAGAKEPGFGSLFQLAEHPRHGDEHRQPLPDLPELVDPHADQEDHEGTVYLSRHALVDDQRHGHPRSHLTAVRSRERPRAITPPYAIWPKSLPSFTRRRPSPSTAAASSDPAAHDASPLFAGSLRHLMSLATPVRRSVFPRCQLRP